MSKDKKDLQIEVQLIAEKRIRLDLKTLKIFNHDESDFSRSSCYVVCKSVNGREGYLAYVMSVASYFDGKLELFADDDFEIIVRDDMKNAVKYLTNGNKNAIKEMESRWEEEEELKERVAQARREESNELEKRFDELVKNKDSKNLIKLFEEIEAKGYRKLINVFHEIN
jgi:hypothetical protein